MLDLAKIENGILELNPDVPEEKLFEMISAVGAAKTVVKELDRMLDNAMYERLLVCREIIYGDIRYYLGEDKTVKCVDVRATMNAVLDASGGDLDKMSECLSSNAFKPGETRKLLPSEVFDECFETKVKPTIREGRPSKAVLQANMRFLK
jgi:hypothetical protein